MNMKSFSILHYNCIYLSPPRLWYRWRDRSIARETVSGQSVCRHSRTVPTTSQ